METYLKIGIPTKFAAFIQTYSLTKKSVYCLSQFTMIKKIQIFPPRNKTNFKTRIYAICKTILSSVRCIIEFSHKKKTLFSNLNKKVKKNEGIQNLKKDIKTMTSK